MALASFHGVVYTRKWVVDLILDIAGYSADRPLLDMRICEPSCGEGSFLKSITERLACAARSEGRLSFDDLESCVIAYDIDEESVAKSREIVTCALVDSGLTQDEACAIARSWIHRGDFLLTDTPKCDYVIGNPPYLRAVEIDREKRDAYCKAIDSMTRGCDLFVGFIQHGMDSLNDNGVLAYICADRWLQNQYGTKLRNYLVDNGFSIDSIVRMYGVDAFESEVDAYPSITRISKRRKDIYYADCEQTFGCEDVDELRAWLSGDGKDYDGLNFSACLMPKRIDGSVVPLAKPERVRLVNDLAEKFPTLEESGVKLGIGLATGRDDVFIVDSPNVVEADRMLPAFSMRDYRRRIDKQRWLVNPWSRDNRLVDLDEYPRMKAYFELHREDLAKRHVAKKSGDYYRTIDKPNWSIFGREMLLWPDMAAKADPVWSDGSKYPCHNCYWMISDVWDLKVLAGLLMSEIAESFIDALGVKMRGGTLRFQAQYLRLIHIPPVSNISSDTASKLRLAFENNDREAATVAAKEAYGL